MNSLCIKTNNEELLSYLKNEFNNFNMLNVFYSQHEFKSYKNIIIHYKGIDTELFYEKLASILSFLVIDYFENDFLESILYNNYFYFEDKDLDKIFDLCCENLCNDGEYSFQNREMVLFDYFYDYISNHNSIILTGFINFRLIKYKQLLESLIDFSVNEFIIEREYLEFVSLLRMYIKTQPILDKTIHIIILDSDTFLLDENFNSIEIDKKSLNAKYLSDISFSHNDYILNTLLNILPKKIILHSVSLHNFEFINTLKLIFENRLEICTDCDICNLYKNLLFNKVVKLSLKNPFINLECNLTLVFP